MKKSLAALAAPGVLFVAMSLPAAPPAAAQPDAQCQDPAYTTAIVYPQSGPYEHTPVVACVPVSVVSSTCTAPLGAPHQLLHPLGQGGQPECRSVYGPLEAGIGPYAPGGPTY